MLKKICTFSAVILFAAAAKAQSSDSTIVETPLKISGSVDVYYRFDFQKNAANSRTSFTPSHNSFELGMASVKLEKSYKNVSFVADLGFGRRASDFSYNEDGILESIKQLYVTYAPADWVKFTAGSWATHVGYELVDPILNRNYSMSYMFSYGPFFHTGVKADFTSGKSGFMVGLANATDYKFAPPGKINKKFFLAQYSYAASDNFKAYLNYVGGQAPDTAKISQFDLVLLTKLSGKFGIGFNGTVNSAKLWANPKYSSGKSWWGSAVYLNFDPTDKFGITWRNEYLSDAKGRLFFGGYANGGSIFASTLSANLKVGSNFVIIPELRSDNASKSIFSTDKGAAKKSTTSFLVAAVYAF